MTRLDLATVRRVAASSIGAMILSATCIAGAIAPARAAEAAVPCAPLSVVAWQAEVGGQLDAKLAVPTAALAGRDHLVAAIDVAFDHDGRFAGAAVSRGSGVRAVDAEVLRIAGAIDYPALPVAYRGRAQTVTIQAWFDVSADQPATQPREGFARG